MPVSTRVPRVGQHHRWAAWPQMEAQGWGSLGGQPMAVLLLGHPEVLCTHTAVSGLFF